MMTINMTYHAKVERIDRLVHIAQTVGFGEEIILTCINRENNTRECLTETGVIMIKAMHDETLVTAFIANIDKASAMYSSMGRKIPQYIARKIRNNKKYNRG